MGVFPSENVFKIMQFSPKSNFTSGFFILLPGKNHAIFPKIIGHGPLPLAVNKSPGDISVSPTLQSIPPLLGFTFEVAVILSTRKKHCGRILWV
jgi:hypothetical protein